MGDFTKLIRRNTPEPNPPKKETKQAKDDRIIVGFRLTKAQWEDLNHYLVDKRTSMQAVVTEALAEFFKNRGLQF